MLSCDASAMVSPRTARWFSCHDPYRSIQSVRWITGLVNLIWRQYTHATPPNPRMLKTVHSLETRDYQLYQSYR